MKRGAALLLALLTAVPVLLAQEGPAAFDSREWDFGAIREADGVVSHAFTVFNGDSHPLRLTRAIPGCSCISASLPGKDIAPGQSATVEVRFTPAGAAGLVERTVEIQAAGGRSLGVLLVRADVLPADRSIQERYPVVLAEGLYASRADIRFGYLERGKSAGKVIFIANASDKPMRLRAEGIAGTHYRVVCPGQLAPGEESRVEVWCDTPADPDYFATLRASLRLTPDGVPALRELPVSGLCLTQAPESPNAPRLRNAAVRLQRKPLSRKLQGTLEITNDGRTDLVIHAIELPDGIVCSQPGHTDRHSRPDRESLTIAPGQTTKLTLTAPEGFGAADLRLTVFSNDPLRPAKEIPINIL
ncbi:MAG: DUF1573 domain-containing protein [Bacteroidales bacterium]|nr:DUF1573 domain-containing protein [Bacteroidales bacterium]